MFTSKLRLLSLWKAVKVSFKRNRYLFRLVIFQPSMTVCVCISCYQLIFYRIYLCPNSIGTAHLSLRFCITVQLLQNDLRYFGEISGYLWWFSLMKYSLFVGQVFASVTVLYLFSYSSNIIVQAGRRYSPGNVLSVYCAFLWIWTFCLSSEIAFINGWRRFKQCDACTLFPPMRMCTDVDTTCSVISELSWWIFNANIESCAGSFPLKCP